jgi:excisionase family DNA binding protein
MTMLTTSSVARRLGVAEVTVRLWARTGRLRATRTETGLRLFAPADVERLADEIKRHQGPRSAA